MRKEGKVFVILGIIVMGLMVFFFLVFLPKTQALNQLRGDLQSIHRKVEKAREEVATLPLIKERIIEAKDKFHYLERRLPEGIRTSEIVELLTGELKGRGIELISLLPSIKEKREEKVGRIDIDITAYSSYFALTQSLGGVGRLPLLFNVENLTIERDENIAPYLLVELVLTTYYLEEESR